MARLPDQIGKYNIVERIGKGGMGMVYKAEHPTLDRFVILKKLNVSGDPVIRERFRREAEIMLDFRTDYVVDVYDHFRHASSDYIALEYIDGVSLDEILARERYLSSDLALAIVRDCCRGLDYVHSKGVVHRDVKPGNVIIGNDGSVKLLDFGIASRSDTYEDDLTQEGMTLGTVAYIAPEQIERSRDVDRRVDIYSTGAMLYEMTTGRKPFTGGFNPETVNRIQRGRYRSPRRVNPQVSRLASRIITKCMKRRPKRRFQTAGEIVSLLDDFFRRTKDAELRTRIAGLARAEADDGGARRKRRIWPVLALGVVALLAAGLTLFAMGRLQPLVVGDSHSIVQFQIRLRKSERSIGEHFIRIELSRQVEAGYSPASPVLPLLRVVRALETPDYVVLRSRLLTVPAGRYRSSIRVEGAITQDEFSLVSLVDLQETFLIETTWDPVALGELGIAAEAYDSYTSRPIDEARIEVEVGGRWMDLEPSKDLSSVLSAALADLETTSYVPLSALGSAATAAPAFRPGDTVRLRVEHPAYLPVTTILSTDALVGVAAVRVGLIPRASRVEEER